jgi:hypothetical protein
MGARAWQYGCGLALGVGCSFALGCGESENASPAGATQAGGPSGGGRSGGAGQPAQVAGGGSATLGVGGASGAVGGGGPSLAISGEVDGSVVVFDQDVQAYNGRAPMMEVSARKDDGTTLGSLRIMVIPEAGVITPGDYRCQDGSVVIYSSPQRYETSQAPGECSIHVDEAGLTSGQIFSGTFSAKVFSTGGDPTSTIISEGEFRAIVD